MNYEGSVMTHDQSWPIWLLSRTFSLSEHVLYWWKLLVASRCRNFWRELTCLTCHPRNPPRFDVFSDEEIDIEGYKMLSWLSLVPSATISSPFVCANPWLILHEHPCRLVPLSLSLLCEIITHFVHFVHLVHFVHFIPQSGPRTKKIPSTASGVSVDGTAANSQVFLKTGHGGCSGSKSVVLVLFWCRSGEAFPAAYARTWMAILNSNRWYHYDFIAKVP